MTLVMCMLLTIFPISVFAADVVDSGTCGANGDNLTWALDFDGKLTIVTPADGTVTSIGAYAFSGCDNLTNIVIPNCVKSVGRRAFANCYNLKSIAIPNGIKSIAPYAHILQLVARNEEKLTATLTEAQKETFEKFKDGTSEISSMTEVTAFKLGLRLTAEAFIGGNSEQELISE